MELVPAFHNLNVKQGFALCEFRKFNVSIQHFDCNVGSRKHCFFHVISVFPANNILSQPHFAAACTAKTSTILSPPSFIGATNVFF